MSNDGQVRDLSREDSVPRHGLEFEKWSELQKCVLRLHHQGFEQEVKE